MSVAQRAFDDALSRLEALINGYNPRVKKGICKVCGHEWWRHEAGNGRCFYIFGSEGEEKHECGCEGEKDANPEGLGQSDR